MAVEIDAIQSAKSIGWTDALLSRLGANSVSLNASLTLAGGGSNIFLIPQSSSTLSISSSSLAANDVILSTREHRGFASGIQVSVIGGTTAGSSTVGVGLVNNRSLAWSSTSNNPASSLDTILLRDAANTLALRNGANAQAFRLYGTYTDASNYRRLITTMSTAGVAEIKPDGAGTGASGNVLHISGLPTSNPGPGILWNNAGTPAIGT